MNRIKFYILPFIITFYSCTNLQGKKELADPEEVKTSEPIIISNDINKTNLTPVDYIAFIENRDNGMVVDKKIGPFEFSAIYKPHEYVALTNLRNLTPTKEEFTSEMENIKDQQYYTLKIKVEQFDKELLRYDLKSDQQYEDRVNYFAFKMQNDIKLIEGKDTLDCALFHFERNYGIAPIISFVLGFPATDNGNKVFDKTLSVDEKIFGTGKINLTVSKENIVKIPELNLN